MKGMIGSLTWTAQPIVHHSSQPSAPPALAMEKRKENPDVLGAHYNLSSPSVKRILKESASVLTLSFPLPSQELMPPYYH